MDLTELDVVKRVLAEHHVEPERALAGLLRTVVTPHFASRLRSNAPASRQLSLVSLLDASGGGSPSAGPTVLEDLVALLQDEHRRNADDDEASPAHAGRADLARVQTALLRLLAESLALGGRQADVERGEAGVRGETPTPSRAPDRDDRPPMRLVRD